MERLGENLYIDDLLDAIDFIIHENIRTHTLNIGTGLEISIKILRLKFQN